MAILAIGLENELDNRQKTKVSAVKREYAVKKSLVLRKRLGICIKNTCNQVCNFAKEWLGINLSLESTSIYLGAIPFCHKVTINKMTRIGRINFIQYLNHVVFCCQSPRTTHGNKAFIKIRGRIISYVKKLNNKKRYEAQKNTHNFLWVP